ncbi:MAG TPA: helix-turn-helix domain-containing protein [Candidatus Acidoferrum sp.]|nr:helix-turn-helix domain-containing protein [Candidatus Acidoferrum sp.]
MPAKPPVLLNTSTQMLLDLGAAIRARRKQLGVSVVQAAAAAGMSRITWHRVEKGEASVTIGAYANAAQAVGLQLQVAAPVTTKQASMAGVIPALIKVDAYPQLRALAWQLPADHMLTAREAWAIYDRNQRHLDLPAMNAAERELLTALQQGMGHHDK